MDSFQSLKQDLQTINRDISDFLAQLRDHSDIAEPTVDEWRHMCAGIEKQMKDDVVRVAVVGAIKSGKSTFINAILQSDYLKRGAGVVTSIVTRIRSGPYLKAILYFKSWDEVNAEIEQALALFPEHEAQPKADGFDIRREEDRTKLKQRLQSLQSDLLISNGSRSVSTLLLELYLQGYASVKSLVASESTVKAYEDDLFEAQKRFVGNDSLAVFLKDIQLEVNSAYIDSNIELADCQGSDSPNPLHLAMIQDYLLKTHLIVYVISSRTGLRQADIRFLSIIKQMGIIDNILFVINCDFSEHESVDDLEGLVERTRSDLSILKPDPRIFVFSSLYNLFRSSPTFLSEKDAARFAGWQRETDLVSFSDQGSEAFLSVLNAKLSRERYQLLLQNNMERLALIGMGMQNLFRIQQDILNKDTRGVEEVLERIEYHMAQMHQIRSLVKSTLDGAARKIKQDVKEDVDRFFDPRVGQLLQGIKTYIRNHQVDFNQYEAMLENARFTDTLFLIFQDFKAALDAYVAESINPKIIKFIGEEELKVGETLAAVGEPFETMVSDTIAGYQDAMKQLGVRLLEKPTRTRAVADFKRINAKTELSLPPLVTTMRYSPGIRTEAVVRFGAYTVARFIGRLFRKTADSRTHQKIRALEDGVKRIKRETERSVVLHFKDYQENVKFQYIVQFIDLLSNRLYEILSEQFRSYSTDVSKIMDLVKGKHVDKASMMERLSRMEVAAISFTRRITNIRERIESVFATENSTKEVLDGDK
jgi:GTPase SAR1 family protein